MPSPFTPLARKSRDLLRAVSLSASVNVWLFGQIKRRGHRHAFISVCWGPPMTRQIRASTEELEHAIIVSNDVMREGEKMTCRDKKVKQSRRLTRVKIWLEEYFLSL